jgi:hypothetical protein
MKTILTLIQGEFLKIKGTLIIWALVLAPILYGIIILQIFIEAGDKLLVPNQDPWIELNQRFWPALLTLFVPIFSALIISISYYLDSKNDMWKIYYTLPIAKQKTYIAKSLFTLLVIAILFLLVTATMPIIAAFLNSTTKLPKFEGFLSYCSQSILPVMFKALGGTVCLWAIQNWISFRFDNFLVSTGVALVGTVVVLIGLQGWPGIIHFPYAYPFLAISEKPIYDSLIPIYWKSIGYGLLIFLASCIDHRFFNKQKV